MLDKILCALAVLFMLTGLIAFIYFILLKLLTPKRKQHYIAVIPLKQDNNPTSLVGSAIEKRNICGESQYCEIIAVDFGMDAETRAFVENMYGKNDKFSICDYRNMHKMINDRLSML